LVRFFYLLCTLSGGTTIVFANATVARFAVSRLVVTRSEAQRRLRCWVFAHGVRHRAGRAGFRAFLYAENLEDDLNEIFLKRSYWGNGGAARPSSARQKNPQTSAMSRL